MQSNLKGALVALVAFGLYATHDAIVKLLGAGYSPIQIVFFSALMSFPLATVMLIGDGQPGTLRPVHPWWVAIRTVVALFTGLAAFYAFSVLPLAQVYAILFASPLLITVLAIPLLGETVRIRRWLAVIVGLIGVLVVLRPGATDLSAGHLAALLAAAGAALASVILRKIGREERPVVILLYPLMANVVATGIALPFVYEPMPIRDIGLLAVVSVLGFVGSRVIVVAYAIGEAAIVAPMQYSQILWATAFGLMFFDETPDLWTATGAAIIIASGIYIVLRESRLGTSRTTPVLRTRSRAATPSGFRAASFLRLRGKDPNAPRGGK